MRKFRFGSLCSGIEAASVAWEPLGWEPAFFAEIEPFPCAVLKHHWPSVPNLGNMEAKDFVERAKACGPIDLMVAGCPCTSFSVAGLRGGLGDPRGNLTLVYARILMEMRPRYFVFENVPGLLSDAKGETFRAVIEAFKLAGYHVEGNILDTQFMGAPQRRRRLYLVGRLEGTMLPEELEAIVLQKAMLEAAERCEYRQFAEAAEKACSLAPSFYLRPTLERSIALDEELVKHARRSARKDSQEARAFLAGRDSLLASLRSLLALRHPGDLSVHEEAPPEQGGEGRNHQEGHGEREGDAGNAGGSPLAVSSPSTVAFNINAAQSCAKKMHAKEAVRTRCLDSQGGFASEQGGTVVVQDDAGEGENGEAREDGVRACVVALAQNQRGEIRAMDKMPNLTCSGGKPGEGYPAVILAENQQGELRTSEVCTSISGQGGKPGQGYPCVVLPILEAGARTGNGNEAGEVPFVAMEGEGDEGTDEAKPMSFYHHSGLDQAIQVDKAPPLTVGSGSGANSPAVAHASREGKRRYIVRRLSPRECCRLQGFPDDHAFIPYKGAAKKHLEELALYLTDTTGREWSEEEARKMAADSHQYRAYGNSFSVPVVRWVGTRIMALENWLEERKK